MTRPLSRRGFLSGSLGLAAAAAVPAWALRVGLAHAGTAFSVGRFVEDASAAAREGQKAVEEVLARAMREPGSVLSALGAPRKAGFDVVHRSSTLTVLNVAWAPSMVLYPHNHNMWASIGVYTGREDNLIWSREGDTIEAVRAASLSEKEVFSLDPSAIHSIVNPTPRFTGALHVYGGDFFAPGRSEWDPDSLVERPFDLDGVRKQFEQSDAPSE